jgi:biofilm PGA synthesis lipoprotein PgaB
MRLALITQPANAETSAVPMQGEFLGLCYHNVEDTDPDQQFNGVTTSKLVEQLAWLKHEGYHPVSVDQILEARAGGKPLPPKAVLLTFDDGYASFYTRVYPVLRAFHFPAVVAVVDEWMKGNPGDKVHPGDHVNYGQTTMPRDAFLTWKQIREMQKSGLIEVASHTHALHLGILANPQGNSEPSAVTLKYNPATKAYETSQDYIKRIEEDAKASTVLIEQKTGKRPRIIVWPYGAYNQTGITIQDKNGMSMTLSLDDGFAKVNSLNVPRILIKNDPEIDSFASQTLEAGKVNPVRIVQVDLDYVYDADAKQMAQNIDALISRIHNMKITSVFLQAFADPKGTGLASAVYFPNRHLPMRADLFNHIAWQLRTRANVKVFGWLPVLSFDFGSEVTPVMAWNPKTQEIKPDPKAYHRASPFDPAARKMIIELYEDMARQGSIDGILFHDDAMLSDFEDAGPLALAAYKKAGFPESIADIRANPKIMGEWTSFKTNALIDFTHELTSHVKLYRSPVATVRNIYASLVLNPKSEEWFAQSYSRFLEEYDYVAIEAMPKMENVPDSKADEWLQTLIDTVAANSVGLKRTIFELQAVDWRKQSHGEARAIPTEELAAQMRLLLQNGAMNFGYYPDDFVTNTPDASLLHRDFSIQTYPYLP